MVLFGSDKSQALKSIDLIVPVLVTGAVGYYAFTRVKDWRVILIIVLGAAFLAYVLTSQVTKVIDTARKRPGKVDVPDDVPGNTDASFDAKAFAARVWKDVDGWAILKGHDSALWSEFSLLSNANLVKVYNEWNRLYFDKNRETLPQAIAAEKFYDWDGKMKSDATAVVNRLYNLGLN